MKHFLLSALLLLAFSAVYADPQSTAFTYQGNLTSNGQPANGSFDLTFKLFGSATGTDQIGSSIVMTGFQVNNGFFTTDLDFPTAFTGQQQWVEVTVGTQTLSPRQPVNSAPVATYALNGGNAISFSAVFTAADAASASGIEFLTTRGITTTPTDAIYVVPHACSNQTLVATVTGGTMAAGQFEAISVEQYQASSHFVGFGTQVLTCAVSNLVLTCTSTSNTSFHAGDGYNIQLFGDDTSAGISVAFTCQ